LDLAEADRLMLPFAMTGSRELLEALPRHQTAHAALLADILDLLSGGYGGAESPPVPGGHRGVAPRGLAEQLSPGELRVLRYLPSNLSRPQIATELSVSVNTISTHIRSIYAKLGADDRSTAVYRARQLRLLALTGIRRGGFIPPAASPRRPCPAASRSGCGSPPGCAPASAARCTSSTSRPPACTRSTCDRPWLAGHLGVAGSKAAEKR
jgi:DNA-binding CsgD family transcriptional regulator